jgi:outer membrane lipoprotein-sorting protein
MNSSSWRALAGTGLLGTLLCASGMTSAQQPILPPLGQMLPSIVPMPPLPPLPKEGTPANAAVPRGIAPAGVPSNLAAAASAAQPARPGGFDAAQRATVERVNSYFNAIGTLVGNFVQVGPDGRKTEGDFYMQKPGKVRFDYDPPSPIELIADGSSVVVRDRKLATQDLYPLSQTPLRFLLSERIDLLKDSNVVGVYQDDLFITVVLEEKTAMVGTHRLMIMFGAKDAQLKQWTVTDPQGYDTTVAVYNLDQTRKPDPALFKIDYHRPLQ